MSEITIKLQKADDTFIIKEIASSGLAPTGGASVGSAAPLPLGSTAVAGTSGLAARQDHVHPYPTAAQVGAVAKSVFNAKGDLPVGTSDDNLAVLGVGTNGQVLTADSTQTTGVKWAAPYAIPLPISQGGTGSITRNFVDLTSGENVGGVKNFTSSPTVPTATSTSQAANLGNITTAIAAVANSFVDVTKAPYNADKTGVANASTAIQSAIDAMETAGGGSVYIPAGIYKINAKLVMKMRVRVYGDGAWTSRLVAAAGLNNHVVENKISADGIAANGEFTAIEDLHIDGNAAGQSAGNWYGIHHDMNPQFNWAPASGPPFNDIEYDPHHLVRNVMITNTKSDGYFAQGRSEIYLDRVFTFKTGRYGIRPSFDSFLNHCTAAWAASNGFQIEESSVRGTGCKAFFNGQSTLGGSDGHGFFFANGQGGINFGECEAQDNAGAGFALNNCQRAYIQGVADTNSNGHIAGRGTGQAGAYPAVDIWSSFDNHIDVVAFERKAYDSTSYQIYALQIRQNSTGNTIRMKHSATTYNGAAVSTAVMTTSNALPGNAIFINNQEGVQGITYAASITPNPYLGGNIRVGTLTGNITVNDPATANRHHGLIVKFIFLQDGTGGRSVTFGAGYSPGNWTINTTANQPCAIDFMWDSTSSKWIRCSG